MLEELTVRRFKSFDDVTVRLPRLAVLLGPNAAGKSNFIDAIQALSRIASSRTLADALSESIRGYPIESFAFNEIGLPGLLSQKKADFELEAKFGIQKEHFIYRVKVAISPETGALNLADEYLAILSTRGEVKGNPVIEKHESGEKYQIRIGVLGNDLGPFLYRLQAPDTKRYLATIRRTMHSIIPSIENITVELDKKRGVVDVGIRQEGIDFSARVVSEGTLRVLALCTLALNPWCGSLVSFEEPENGVHPRRLELIADLLCNLAISRNVQVIVNTHSPIFCSAILRKKEEYPDDIKLLRTKRQNGKTVIEPLDIPGPLFEDNEIKKVLSTEDEGEMFERLKMMELLDE